MVFFRYLFCHYLLFLEWTDLAELLLPFFVDRNGKENTFNRCESLQSTVNLIYSLISVLAVNVDYRAIVQKLIFL